MSGEAAPAAACYAYGVVPSSFPPEALEEARGVADAAVEALAEGDVAALTSGVPLEEFGEEPLRANLNDRTWLERTARAHEDVLERALAAGPVVPFRLCTIYRGPDQVRELLAARATWFAELLDGLRGRIELGVKAYLDRDRFAEAAGPPAEAGDPGSGRAYLLRRQRERTLAEEAERFGVECARASHERLAAAAVAARVNPPQPPELSGRHDEMLLNGAYLVPAGDRHVGEVVAELEAAYGDRGVSYEVTGPWPPYNFVPREVGEE